MLTAKFDLDYEFPFMLGKFLFDEARFDGVSSGQPVSVHARYDDFEVKIEIYPGDLATKAFYGGGIIYGAKKITIHVSKICEEIPEPHEIQNFLSNKLEEYQPIALKALTKLTEYFKYNLRNPFLKIPRFDIFHKGATWVDSTGRDLGTHGEFHVFGKLSGNVGDLSSIHLNTDRIPDLQSAMSDEREINVVEELLSEAQTSIIERRIAKAVIDMAVACEICIKTSYFKVGSAAYEVINFLEEKRQIEVSPIELIGKVAERAFGKSFKTADPSSFEAIDNLFRCRNKVAHRAQLEFNGKIDNKDHKMIADIELCHAWWNAVEALRLWLANQSATS